MSLGDVLARIGTIDGVTVTAGVQAVDGVRTYPEGGPFRIVDVAIVNEFGSRNGRIPSRPWLRTAYDQQIRKWSRMMDQAVEAKIAGGTGERELRLLGVVMVGDVRESLLDGDWRDNAESTKARKGSDQPLIDKGQLLSSQRAAVEVPGSPPQLVG